MVYDVKREFRAFRYIILTTKSIFYLFIFDLLLFMGILFINDLILKLYLLFIPITIYTYLTANIYFRMGILYERENNGIRKD